MQVLVVGGGGVIGAGLVPALLRHGHRVRIASRHAEDTRPEWPAAVECVDADVTHPASCAGIATGCQAIIHVTGIVEEHPPDVTFESVNVGGVTTMLAEAERARVDRFLFISSLGAETGQSLYQQSKFRAEELVRRFSGNWTIIRSGHVYGPGDEMISMVMKLVRASPVVPQVGFGDQRFQPLWFDDLGEGLCRCLPEPGTFRDTIEVAGAEVITVRELLNKLAGITQRPTWRLPVPAAVTRIGIRVGEWLNRTVFRHRLPPPLNESKLCMLLEENVIAAERPNALTGMLGIDPVPLDRGLRMLADMVPEQTPADGIGAFENKTFQIRVKRSGLSASELMERFRTKIGDVMPIDFSAEPDAPREVRYGRTLSAHLPGRGHIQVRVDECEPDRVTFVTVEGHPLAGAVTFSAVPVDGDLQFLIETWTRAANPIDWLAIHTIGWWFQDRTWKSVAKKMVMVSGGEVNQRVRSKGRSVTGVEAAEREAWAKKLVMARKRRVSEESRAVPIETRSSAPVH